MRLLLLVGALALGALPLAPGAAACHPSFGVEVPVPGVATLGLTLDPGCPHDAAGLACVAVAWQLIPAPPSERCALGQ